MIKQMADIVSSCRYQISNRCLQFFLGQVLNAAIVFPCFESIKGPDPDTPCSPVHPDCNNNNLVTIMCAPGGDTDQA